MYNELVKRLRNCIDSYCAGCKYESLLEPGNFVKCMNALLGEAADAIEELQKLLDGVEADNDSLCKTIDLYRKLLGGHPDPRGEDGEPGIKCVDCQRDCQMIGLDMPACTAYEPPKEKT